MGTVCAVDNNLRKRLERGLAARQLLEEEERDERRGAVATGESWSTQDERRDRLGRGVSKVLLFGLRLSLVSVWECGRCGLHEDLLEGIMGFMSTEAKCVEGVCGTRMVV